jgi:hypothetical protein
VGIVYRIDKTLDGVVAVWDGSITPQDHAEQVVRLAADTDWPPGRFHLTDATTVADFTLPDPGLVDVLLEGTGVREHVAKVVIVRPEFLRGSCIEESGASFGGTTKAFSDITSACAHLGVNDRTIRATIDGLREELGRNPR